MNYVVLHFANLREKLQAVCTASMVQNENKRNEQGISARTCNLFVNHKRYKKLFPSNADLSRDGSSLSRRQCNIALP